MIAVPVDPNYHKNLDRYGNIGLEDRCCICARPIKSRTFSWMHIFYGDEFVTEEEAQGLDSNGDLGVWMIGPDCLKKHPELKPYAHKTPPNQRVQPTADHAGAGSNRADEQQVGRGG